MNIFCHLSFKLEWSFKKKFRIHNILKRQLDQDTLKTESTAQKMKYSIKDLSSKCDQIHIY